MGVTIEKVVGRERQRQGQIEDHLHYGLLQLETQEKATGKSYGRALLPNKNRFRVKVNEEVLVREKNEKRQGDGIPRVSRSSTR